MKQEKTVLITGTSTGIGSYCAKLLSLSGYMVYATMRDVAGKNSVHAKELKTWAEKENARLAVTELDVTDDDSVNSAVQKMVENEGHCDIVVNNAGIAAQGGYAEAYETDQLQRLFEVNVFGSNRVIRAVLPHMRKQKEGLVIQISSLAASLPMPFHGNYPATKIAVETIVEGYRHELAPFGVDFVIIQPGGFPTALIGNAITPLSTARIVEYGDLADLPEKIFAGTARALSGPDAPDPQAVADAVHDLIEIPYGQRPLRTIVDRMGLDFITDAAASINTHNDDVKRHIMEKMGLSR